MLCVLVVFIHSNISQVVFENEVITLEVPLIIDIIRTFISVFLASIAVPLFFFISSYLLFKKDDPYPVLIKKKMRSLFVPFCLWNGSLLLLFFISQRIPLLRQFFKPTILTQLHEKGVIAFFYGPLVYQLWFVRDLFLCVVFSPVIKWLVKRLPAFSLVAVLLFAQSELLYGGIRRAIFYFSLGGLAVRFDLSYKNIARIRFWDIGVLFVLIIILRFYFHFSAQTALAPLPLLNILVGGVLLLKLSGCVCENERAFAVLKYLSQFTFWIFASDPILVAPIRKIWIKCLPFEGAWLLAEYFGAVIIGICVSLGVALLLKRIAPKVYAVFTGGRAQPAR